MKIGKKTITFVLIIILLITTLSLYVYNEANKVLNDAPTPKIEKVYISDDNKLIVNYSLKEYKRNKKIYCIYKNSNTIPNATDEWTLAENNTCSFDMSDKPMYVYLKNEENEITFVKTSNELGKILNLKINKEQVYVAVKGTYTIKATFESIGKINKEITYYSDDETIAKVDNNGKITGVKKGNTKIHAKVMDEDVSVDVMVTNLITVRPKAYNNKKEYLPCGKYNEKENDTLDAILKDRIEDAGYKTRAGVVEAARFLTLEFPYKIRYFSENGRGSTNGVDGEGRYYHIGLYLDESRYSKIGKKAYGPKTWGCSLYSRPSKGNRSNGFDCSGFISWVLLNGGFDVGDIGAGLAPHLDLTDYGERIRFNANVIKSGKVKVGDLLSSGGLSGGHIALIAGEDDKYYYVAESLWTPPNVAVIIKAYDKKTIFNRYYYVMLMDSYYKEDGNLTKLWY